MYFDVLGAFGTAGLDEFLGDGPVSASIPLAGQNSGNDAFTGIGVDSGDEIYFFHSGSEKQFVSKVVPLWRTNKRNSYGIRFRFGKENRGGLPSRL